MWSLNFLLTILALTICLVAMGSHGETVCERWQGKWYQKFNAVRCKKDNAPADKIVVSHNIDNTMCLGSPCVIKYSVGLWTGVCGHEEGHRRLFTNQYLNKRSVKVYPFDAAGPNICRELYVFECTKDGRPYDCYYAVRVVPA